MKIALVSPYDFAFPGGVVNHISALEQRFTRMGHEVSVIAPASRAVPAFGDRFIPIGKPRPVPTSGSVARITLSVHLASTIKNVLEREKFDIVHLHEPFMPMLCSAVLRFSDAPNIGTFHAYNGSPGYNICWPVGRIILRQRQRKLDGRIAVSKPAMDYASKYVHGEYEIIPNGIDLKRFNPDVQPIEAYQDNKKNILFVGRLEHRKGLNYLLKAYQQVKREIPDSRLIVVGPGIRLRNRYEKWVRRNHLDDVVFVGYSTNEDLPRYYKTADVFCAPATCRESFGIVLLEAMAVGKPVVATNIDGYASVVSNNEDGLLVPPKDSKSLAESLIKVMTDKNLSKKMGDAGRLKAGRFSWEEVTRRVLDYYGKIRGDSSSRNNGHRNNIKG